MNEGFSIVLSTFADKVSAERIAKLLVEQRLAACVQMFPIESIYLWEGEVCQECEVILFIKSKTEAFENISATIKAHHSYDVPEIIQIPITDGLPQYLRFIATSCGAF